MIGGEHDVDVVGPTARRNGAQHTGDRLVDELVLDVCECVDLAHLIVGERLRNPTGRCFVVGDELALVPQPPVTGFGVENRLALGPIDRVVLGQIEIAPIHAMEFGLRRIPRMMRIGETHPAEPVVVRIQRIEPGDGAIGHPLGVIPLAWNRVVVNLRARSVAPTTRVHLQRHVEHSVVHADRFGVVLHEPACVVEVAHAAVRRRFHVIETAMQVTVHLAREVTRRTELVLDEAQERVEKRLEVGLADERGAVAGVVQGAGDAGRFIGKGHAVHPHSVRRHVLPGDHGGARRHAHHALRMCARVVDAVGGQPIDGGCASHRAAVAAERIEALLIGGDEQNLATHQDASIVVLSRSRPSPAAPAIMRAMTSGSASVE